MKKIYKSNKTKTVSSKGYATIIFMRILIIGNSHAASSFSDLLSKNENNIVFTNLKNSNANFIEIGTTDVCEWREFALANEIDLTVLCDFETICENFYEVFTSAGLAIFAPDKDALKICSSKSFAKKFMYRNKIKTPQFQIFEKQQLALDWVRNAKFPVVIKPDEHSNMLGTTICETFSSARKVINNFFMCSVKNIVIENFVSGREFSIYALSDGFRAHLIDFVTTEQNTFAHLGADSLDDATKNNIMNEIVQATITNLDKCGNNYVGILGLDFILDDNGIIYSLEYNPFFDDLDVGLFINAVDENWEKLFESTISGTFYDEFPKIKKHDGNFVCKIDKTLKIHCSKGRTLNEAKKNLAEEEV